MTYACSFLHDCSEFSYAKNIDLSSGPSAHAVIGSKRGFWIQ